MFLRTSLRFSCARQLIKRSLYGPLPQYTYKNTRDRFGLLLTETRRHQHPDARRSRLTKSPKWSADDDLEYHVCFPPPRPSTGGEDFSGDNYATVQDETRTPVVILLGWVGCQDVQLGKYSALYEEKGYITIRYTAPTNDLYFHKGKFREKAVKILELIFDLSLEENPLFFHVFSNSGSHFYCCIVDHLQRSTEHQILQVHGTIFDSAPSTVRIWPTAKAFTYASGVRRFQTVSTIVFSFGYLVFLVLSSLWHLVSRTDNPHFNFLQSIKNDQSRWPQLYLYSKMDEVISYRDIDDIMKYRASLGVDVRSELWQDSGHVRHLQMYPKAYRQQCMDFIELCLQKYS